MMISQPMNDLLNKQITHELFASHAYLGISILAEQHTLKRLAKLFRQQAEEEREHALKILDYILEQDGAARLEAIDAPPAEFGTVLDAIEFAFKHEQKVTKQIHDLVALAEKENDYATRQFLGWFVEEQVEEVSSMRDLLDVARMCGNHLLNLEAYLIHRNAG